MSALVDRPRHAVRPRRLLVFTALAALALLALPAATPPAATPPTTPPTAAPSDSGPTFVAPAMNWVLPIFTDEEGYRSMTLRGSEVRPEGRTIAVTDLSITIFSGDAKSTVDSMLLSPSAVFLPKENRARGDKAVRFIRDDFEVTGVGWTYDHATKTVTLSSNVRVTFRTQIKDILK